MKRNDVSSGNAPRPFLRWAGGKFRLASSLLGFVPQGASDRRYFEPFLGAASLFFALRPKVAQLSDLNAHLINCYQAISDDASAVAKALRLHASQDSEAYYYGVRDQYNRCGTGIAQAARFLYLNRTGFNGVFRVNVQGAYNVPYGRKEKPRFPSAEDLKSVASTLKSSKLRAVDFVTAVEDAKAGDFVYLDPPYPPINGTSYFTHYTKDRFGEQDQKKVADLVRALDKRGCAVMISNADLPIVRRLYKGLSFNRLSVTRFVSSSSKKHSVEEVVITNYDTPKSLP